VTGSARDHTTCMIAEITLVYGAAGASPNVSQGYKFPQGE
jgi:hypothetical protein